MANRSKIISGSIAERIKSLRLNKGLTQKELSENLYKSESTIRMWELGKSEPDLATIQNLSIIFGVSLDFLLSGKNSTGWYGEDEPETTAQGIKIPVLGKVAAGIPISAITDILDYEEISPDMIKDGSEYFALSIKGDSMEPKISEGDVVIVRKQETCESGQIAIVQINGDEATCKKLVKKPNGIVLQSFNPA